MTRIKRFLKQEVFFEAVACGVYAHSLLTFLCDVEYSKIEHDFILVTRDTLCEEVVALTEILLQDFPKDDESLLECFRVSKLYKRTFWCWSRNI